MSAVWTAATLVTPMIKAYSQRLMPPYSGQIQIAESDRARALTMDGTNWEIHFRYGGGGGIGPDGRSYPRSYRRVAYIDHKELLAISKRSPQELANVDERIIELARFLMRASLPFPAADGFEYWLLDWADGSPLALIFSCAEAEQMATYPARPEWTALPAAVMPIEATPEEKGRNDSPANYQLETLIARRAGSKPVARWFERGKDETASFPPCMIREDWQDPADHELCQRYINRQSTRLLMLHNLTHEDRLRLEIAAKDHIFEVERFFSLYPEVADDKLMNAIRVEARLRRSEGSEVNQTSVLGRRDGVLYQ
jgi:hypothetical protein